MSTTEKKNYLDEAKSLLELIDERKITKKEDYLFIESMRSRVRLGGFCTQKQIFWLRDIKDKQLEDKE